MSGTQHEQPVGHPVPGWVGALPPPRTPVVGRHCTVEPLDPARHGVDLHAAYEGSPELWTYMPYGPFRDATEYRAWLESDCMGSDPLYYAVVVGGAAVGVASYLRIQPEMGVIEVGNISYGPALQRTVAATEAMYLMMRRVFDELGYRRYEWKCDSLNAPSRSAAERLGFRFEGIFRQAMVYKDRNRDTAWYAVLDSEWPALKAGFAAWLSPENFDSVGRQRRGLAGMRN